ncbi:putative nucleic acid-binding Zn-ribbon protein [Deinobacterium chartae]|uniref:Putative nucleic acid-binding Zn-ribbon protein n=1 Tax=Deinobacterium chartae TaxID=521158 RepID=A0A841I6P3_9DEIO|nr:S-layer homology domain-containing protein [Deinobacterium chartae]MBB6100080.1 putative nucleic acid-binding Zn-ribbon protein [Deinobacterium chartae]
MKIKALLALTAALSFGALAQTAAPATPAATPAAPAPALSDVPAGHWAKDAVDQLVAKGIITGFPDGTFRGNEGLTRYQAALIIARVLEQVAAGSVTLDDETVTTLRNAVQELAADLAALGVRVADLEDNAVTKDDFARLEEQVNTLAGATGSDPEALKELTDQLEAASIAADTALAQATELQDKFEALDGRVSELAAEVEANAASIAALNDLTVLLNQDILSLQDRVTALETEGVTPDDLEALREFSTLTRRDLTALTDRVEGIDTRVAALESAPKFSISGNVEANYGQFRLTSGSTNFDVDRLLLSGFMGTTFSSGQGCVTTTVNGTTGVNPDAAYFPAARVSCTDTNQELTNGDFNVTLSVKNLTTLNGTVKVNEASVTLGTTLFENPGSTTTAVDVETIEVKGAIDAQNFTVRYDNGYDNNSNFFFNPYLFSNDNDTEKTVRRQGVVFSIDAAKLPLAPKITAVVGTAYPNADRTTLISGTPPVATPAVPLDGNYFGVRAAVNPFGLGELGLAFAQNNNNVTAMGNRNALGADFKFAVGPVNLEGAYVASMPWNQGFDGRDQAFYTDATVNIGPVELKGNFRAIDPQFENGVAGMSANDAVYYGGLAGSKSKAPYSADQVGYGVDAKATFGIFNVGGYYERVTAYDAGQSVDQSFGVNAKVNVFAGFNILAYYNNITTDGNQVAFDGDYGAFYYNVDYDKTMRYSTSFGARLAHDGKAANALVPNLNLDVVYTNFYDTTAQSFGNNDIQVYADYNAKFGGVTVKPLARFHSVSGANTTDYTAYKVGAQVTTDPFDIVLKPSLDVAAVTRSTNINEGAQSGTSISELFARAGLTFNEFLAPNTKFSVGYSYYQASNISSIATGASESGSSATFSPAADRIFRSPGSGAANPLNPTAGTASGNVNGIYSQLDFNGLKLSYGIFNLNPNGGATSTAQAFKVGYNLKF